MAKYRSELPQLGGDLFLTDGGIETTLIFHEGLELRHFAAFDLLDDPRGQAALRRYFRAYGEIAARFDTGLILESATWRASADWGTKLGYSRDSLVGANRRAVDLLEDICREFESPRTKVIISGCVGPRGDGYLPTQIMSAEEAESYHGDQVGTLADTSADMICALTMNYVEESIGIVRAARRTGMPVTVSFTTETNGRLPTGQTLKAAIEQVDEATSGYPVYYVVNCAHPSHFEQVLNCDDPFIGRIRGIRANASRMSHAELNEAAELDVGDPVELATDYANLKKLLPRLNVMGGCCGTDHRHIDQIAQRCRSLFPLRG
jgi:S-methylmethionine-dependent homocysteine/selenocysteine methylase